MTKDKNKVYNRKNFKKAGFRIISILFIAALSYCLVLTISSPLNLKDISEVTVFQISTFIAIYTFIISLCYSYLSTPIFIKEDTKEELNHSTDTNCYDLAKYSEARLDNQLTEDQYNQIVDKIINRIQ